MPSPSNTNHYDVVIVGRGITGISAALALKNLGIKNILLVGPERDSKNCLSSSCVGISTFPDDNSTRIVQSFGTEISKAYLQTMHHGYTSIINYAKNKNISVHESENIIRFASTGHEQDEMQAAKKVNTELGIQSEISEDSGRFVQRDVKPSAILDLKNILDDMESTLQKSILKQEVQRIEETSDKIILHTDTRLISCEVVILACHLNIKRFLPSLQDVLISYADQWTSIEYDASKFSLTNWAIAHAEHSHYSFYNVKANEKSNNLMFVKGARFLRKWAGIEATSTSTLKSIDTQLLKMSQECFQLESAKVINSVGFLECRPCDELPVIGPMYGTNRILLAGGYSGNGITLGYSAGQALAELVVNGKTSLVGKEFYPHRFRSMGE